jgi:hypothetical protein
MEFVRMRKRRRNELKSFMQLINYQAIKTHEELEISIQVFLISILGVVYGQLHTTATGTEPLEAIR